MFKCHGFLKNYRWNRFYDLFHLFNLRNGTNWLFSVIWDSFWNSGDSPEESSILRSFGHSILGYTESEMSIYLLVQFYESTLETENVSEWESEQDSAMERKRKQERTSSSGLICNEATVNNQHRYDTKNPIYRIMREYLNFGIPQQVTSPKSF